MRTSEAFPSQFLKKEDIGDRRVRVTVDHIQMETIQNGDHKENKPVVYFRNTEKGMVLNKGNAEAIQEAANGDDEMDNWGGTVVVLYVDRNVTFGGKRVGGIRISPARKPETAPVEVAEGIESDDVPF